MIRNKCLTLAVAFAMFIAPSANVWAECRAVYRPGIVQQQVIVPSVVTHHQAFTTYGHNTIVVPKAFAVEVLPQYYAAVSDDYRQAEFAKLVAQELARIVENQRQQPAPPANGALPPSEPIPPAKDLPPAGKLAPPGQALKQQSKIGVVLANRCVACHKAGSSEHAFDGDPEKIPEVERLRAFLSVSTGKMPKGRPAVSNEELSIMADWAGAGVKAKN